MSKWDSIEMRLPRENSRIEVKIGNVIKRMYYTAGMKGDDLRFTYWRYVDSVYDYKPKALWLPDYGKVER